MTETSTEPTVRDEVRKRLKKRRDLRGHVLVYLLVNAALVVIWMITDSGGFFWPIFPIVFWGIGVVMNGWDVYVSSDITEEDVDREIARRRR